MEGENAGGASNNTRAAAQSLDGSQMSLGGDATRAAVVGKTDLTAGVGADYYSFTASAGDTVFLGYRSLSATAIPAITLEDAAGATLATAVSGPTNLDRLISSFVVPAAGTYYVFVDATH